MPRRFGRLPFFSRPVAADRASRAQSALESPPIDPDVAPIGPLMLLPAMIYHQVLFDATEITPAWLRSRPGSEREPTGPVTSVAAKRATKPAAPTGKAPTSKGTSGKRATNSVEPKPPATRRVRGPRSGRQPSE